MCALPDPRGTTALRTLQNGVPGNTFVVESGDLRDMPDNGDEVPWCVTCYKESTWSWHVCCTHIPRSVTHVAIYGNVTHLPLFLLMDCSHITSTDLGPLSQVKEVRGHFLQGCTGISALDMSPLSLHRSTMNFFLVVPKSLSSAAVVLRAPECLVRSARHHSMGP